MLLEEKREGEGEGDREDRGREKEWYKIYSAFQETDQTGDREREG